LSSLHLTRTQLGCSGSLSLPCKQRQGGQGACTECGGCPGFVCTCSARLALRGARGRGPASAAQLRTSACAAGGAHAGAALCRQGNPHRLRPQPHPVECAMHPHPHPHPQRRACARCTHARTSVLSSACLACPPTAKKSGAAQKLL